MARTPSLHTLPTHLGVRDPVLWGLNDVQLVKVSAGVLLAAFVLRQAALPFGMRVALSALAVLGAAACALVRIDGRSLDDWLLLLGRYWSRPRALVWGARPSTHPWTRAALATEPSRPVGGCVIRHLRVTWLEPEEAVDLDDGAAAIEPTDDRAGRAAA